MKTCTILLFVFAGLYTNANAQQPADQQHIATFCDGCFKPDDAESCQDIFDLGPPQGCADYDPGWYQGVFGCHHTGERSWVQDFWLRRVKSAQAGESGNQCESWQYKYCAKARKCKYKFLQTGTGPSGEPIYKYWCENGTGYELIKLTTEAYPSGDSCEIPDGPQIGDPPSPWVEDLGF